jgi:spermidine/putrescine transport system substrate-binding protein
MFREIDMKAITLGVQRALATTTLGMLVLGTTAPAMAEGQLNVYNWGDYINPEVLERFSEEFDVEVTLDTYGTNEEMLAKIQAGATGYDIVFPSVHMHDIMYQLGLLARTDIGQHPDFKNIDPRFIRAKTDPEAAYCLPYAWGSVGIVYNKKLVPEGISSWEDFFALGEQGQKIILLDDLRETLGIGLIMNGESVNARNPEAVRVAADYIIERIDDISAFTYDSIPLVEAGDVAAAHWYVGANLFVKENPDTLAYIIPEEGATMYQEDICVLESAPNKDNAIKFLEFYLRPEIAALNVSQQMNGTPNLPALEMIPAEIRQNESIYPPDDVLSKLQIFEDLGQDLKIYNSEWTRVKTAQ